MNAQELRKATIRLAHEKPALRPHLLPLLKAAEDDDADESDKDARNEEGKSMTMDEMTEGMSKEDKAKFEANKDKYKDKFKAAADDDEADDEEGSDKEAALRLATIRLAHSSPELREYLLPLLTAAKSADDDAPEPETEDEDEGSDKEAALRKATIRLAHANPKLRPHLLPLLKQAMPATINLQELGIPVPIAGAILALARGSFGRSDFQSKLGLLLPKYKNMSREIWDAAQYGL